MLTLNQVNAMTPYEKTLMFGYFLNEFEQDAKTVKPDNKNKVESY